MTIKDIYEWAERIGHADAEVIVEYECSDDWYGFNEVVKPQHVAISEDCIVLSFQN